MAFGYGISFGGSGWNGSTVWTSQPYNVTVPSTSTDTEEDTSEVDTGRVDTSDDDTATTTDSFDVINGLESFDRAYQRDKKLYKDDYMKYIDMILTGNSGDYGSFAQEYGIDVASIEKLKPNERISILLNADSSVLKEYLKKSENAKKILSAFEEMVGNSESTPEEITSFVSTMNAIVINAGYKSFVDYIDNGPKLDNDTKSRLAVAINDSLPKITTAEQYVNYQSALTNGNASTDVFLKYMNYYEKNYIKDEGAFFKKGLSLIPKTDDKFYDESTIDDLPFTYKAVSKKFGNSSNITDVINKIRTYKGDDQQSLSEEEALAVIARYMELNSGYSTGEIKKDDYEYLVVLLMQAAKND